MNLKPLSHFYRTYGVRAVLLLLALFLFLNTWGSIQNILRIIQCEQQVADSRQMIGQIELVGALTVDLETAYRGFVVLDRSKYLEPMKKAEVELPAAVSRLGMMMTDDPAQREKIKAVERLINEKIELGQAVVRTRKKAKGISKAILADIERGKDLMDHIRRLLDEITQMEGARLAQRQVEAEASARQTIFFFIFMLVVSLFFLGLGFYQLEKNRKNRLALADYAGKLERSNKDLREFAYIIAHDLKEPIRMMVSFGDLLKVEMGKSLTSSAAEYLSRIQDGARRMGVLIDDLTRLNRVTTEAKPFERVELSAILHEVQTDLALRLKECGGSIELGPLPLLEADPAQMRQLFQNLIGNSLKYRQVNRPPVVRVEGETEPATGKARIWVRDNGIGFEPTYAEKIFDIFQRLHPRDQYEGTGIGLAICRKVVERHGGVITARSKVGEGSTFEIVMPVRQNV